VIKEKDLIIKGALIVDGDGEIYKGKQVKISGDKIVEVGDQIPEKDEEVLYRPNCVITPGLVNLHCHSPMGLMRGLGEDLKIEDWFNQFIWRFETKLKPEDVKVGAFLGISEMLKNGVTAFADHYFFPQQIAEAAEEAGIRADIAPTIFGFGDKVEENIEEAAELIKSWNKKTGRITMQMGPHAPYTCPPEVLEKVSRRAEELGVGAHIHVSETAEQVKESIEQYGKTPFVILEETGLLKHPIIIGHGLWIGEHELDLIPDHAYFAACPKTYMKLAMGYGNLWDYFDRLPICIGTDGAASSNTLNPLEQARLFALIGKQMYGAERFSLQETWRVLMRGHKALGAKTGQIKPGYLADLVIWDLGAPSTWPVYNPLAALLFSADASHVRDVIVDGDFALKEKTLTRLNEEDILKAVRETVEKIDQRAEGKRFAQY